MSDNTHAYIGRKACGCVTGVVVDTPQRKKNVARFMRDCIMDGRTVERVSIETARASISLCKCVAKSEETP